MWKVLVWPHHFTKREVWAHTATCSLTLPLVNEMPVPKHESELSRICLFGVAILLPSTIFLLYFRTNPTAWHFYSFIYYYLLDPPGIETRNKEGTARYTDWIKYKTRPLGWTPMDGSFMGNVKDKPAATSYEQ